MDEHDTKPTATRLRDQHVLASIGQAVVVIELDGTVAAWNDAAEALYGWTAAEALGQDVSALIGATEPHIAAALLDDLRQGIPYAGDWLVRHRNGLVRTIFVISTPVRD